MRVTGIDGCRAGWVAVTLTTRGAAAPLEVSPRTVAVTVAPRLDDLRLAGMAGVDMPLGLLAEGWRSADLLARRALGRRGCCVFAIPPRPVWAETAYADANRRCRELTGRGLSAQAWGLRTKLLEADRYRRATVYPLHEVHPELAFAAIGGAPLPDSKHSKAGLTARHELLAAVGITLPSALALPRGVGEDDLLDAAAVAWSAHRIAAGAAEILTDPAQRADDGTEIAIAY